MSPACIYYNFQRCKLNERAVAVEILEEVEEGAFLNLAIKKHLKSITDAQSRRFTSAIVYTTMENLLRIDHVISSFTKKQRLHRFIKNVLRVGVCQLMFFESVPASAAVNECVKVVDASPKHDLKGFVNAVLRNISRNMGDVFYPSREGDPAGFLSIMYSYPQWICEMYIEEYGSDFAWELLSYRRDEAFTCVRPNLRRISSQELKNKLEDRGLEVSAGKYVEDCLYIKNSPSIDENYFYQKGLMTVQGEASMVVCEAAGVRPGESVLDVCAAPGGKSAYIADKGASLTCWDVHAHRVELMKKNFSRLGVEAKVEHRDASVFDPQYEGNFDVVLIDAPCSAMGLLYRKPDIKYVRKREDIPALAALQRAILEASIRYVKPGGRILYSTCTISRDENEENIDYILKKYPWLSRGEMTNTLPIQLAPRQKKGMLQLFPHIDGVDGFFIAMMRRNA